MQRQRLGLLQLLLQGLLQLLLQGLLQFLLQLLLARARVPARATSAGATSRADSASARARARVRACAPLACAKPRASLRAKKGRALFSNKTGAEYAKHAAFRRDWGLVVPGGTWALHDGLRGVPLSGLTLREVDLLHILWFVLEKKGFDPQRVHQAWLVCQSIHREGGPYPRHYFRSRLPGTPGLHILDLRGCFSWSGFGTLRSPTREALVERASPIGQRSRVFAVAGRACATQHAVVATMGSIAVAVHCREYVHGSGHHMPLRCGSVGFGNWGCLATHGCFSLYAGRA